MYTQIKSYTQLPTTPWQIFFPLFPVYYTQQNTISAAHDNALERKKTKELGNCFQQLRKILFENCNDIKISAPSPKLTSVLKGDICERADFLTAPRFPSAFHPPPRAAPVGSFDTLPITCFVTHLLPHCAYELALFCERPDLEVFRIEENH